LAQLSLGPRGAQRRADAGGELHDAGTFPLRWITRDADAVIDLLGCTRELAEAVSDHPELVITPDLTSWTVLALPGDPALTSTPPAQPHD
jgi:hypothetical protein